jgi:hypothetical protein
MKFFLPGLMGITSGISIFAADLVLQWRLGDEGVTTDGVVVTRWLETDAEGRTSLNLTLKYQAPSRPDQPPRRFLHQASVDAGTYESLAQGARLPLVYVRSDPDAAQLVDTSGPWGVFVLVLVFVFHLLLIYVQVCFFSPGFLAVFYGLASGLRVCLLALGGRSVSGQVEECWLEPDPDRADNKCVTVRFTPPGGSLLRFAEIAPEAYERLVPGREVEVEYVPQCPWICRLAKR